MIPAQCRAARAFLDWTQAQLAEAAGIDPSILADFERGAPAGTPSLVARLRRALERAGVEFTDGGAPGLKLKRPGPPERGLRPEELNAENDG